MGCDNDLPHLLQQWQPGASICLWLVRRMLMLSVYCRVMARRNVGMPTNERMFVSLQLGEDVRCRPFDHS